jgi:hypothetical protein
MAGRYNLWMAAERDSNGNPRIRIEPEGYWYASAGQVQQLDIQDLLRNVDLERLHSRVEIGSEDYIFDVDPFNDYAESIPLRTHGKESYNFEGVCNTDSTLDLKFNFVSDNNVMVDVLLNGADDYDEEIFIIQYSVPPLVANAITTQWQSNIRYYNGQLLNGIILSRHYLTSPVGSNIDPSVGPSQDLTTAAGASYTATLPGQNSAYVNVGVSDFTAPATGFYSLQIRMFPSVINAVPLHPFAGTNIPASWLQYRMRLRIRRFDSSNNLIETTEVVTYYRYPVGNMVFVVGDNVNQASYYYNRVMELGDYVRLDYRFEGSNELAITNNYTAVSPAPSITLQLQSGSGWIRLFSETGGYVEGQGKPPVIVYKFDRHVDLSTWLSLTQNPRRAMAISHTPSVLDTGWVLNAKRNVATGECQWEVMCFPPQTNELP